jgi:hypothetical protein
MKQITLLSIVIAVLGAILTSGSLFTVPYTVGEWVRVDMSRTHVDEAFVLTLFTNRTYRQDSLVRNSSIIQIDVNSSDFVILKIFSYETGELCLERRARGDWITFWTPPHLGNIYSFVFQNPSSAAIDVTAKITEFYFKGTEYQKTTHYRPLLEPIYGYIGIIAILISIALNAAQYYQSSRNKANQEIPHRADKKPPPLLHP